MDTLRRVVSKDLAALASIHAASFKKNWDQDAFAKLLEQTSNAAWLIEEDDEIAAFIVVMSSGDDLEILTIATHPDHRRKGLAKQLLLGVDGKQALGLDGNWFLEVSEENLSAVQFYENLGFLKRGVRKNYYKLDDGRRVDALVYGIKLGHLVC